MSKLFFFVTFFAIGINCHSQGIKIEVTVLDSNSHGIVSSTVVFYDADSTILSAATTDNNGHFTLKVTPKGTKGVLEISHLSYLTQSIEVKKDTSITVYLQDKPYHVDEVIIVRKKPAIEFKEGNLVANVSSIPNASSSNVARVLTTLPGVTASEKEGLTLNGVSATLYIDGRKQTLPVSSVIKMLQALPASSLEQVELLAVGSGMHDASDSGAIINLKTKKQKLDGYYLVINGKSQVYERNRADGSGDIFYMIKKKAILYNSSISYSNRYSRIMNDDSTIYRNGASMSSQMIENSRTNIYIVSTNLAWYVKRNHVLNFNAFVYEDFSKGNSVEPIKLINSSDDRRYILNTVKRGNDDLWSGNIEYSSPDSAESKIVASYGIVYGGLRNKKDFFYQLQPEAEKEWYLYTNPKMIGYRHTGKVDFTQSFSQVGVKLYAGVKTDIGKLNDDVLFSSEGIANNYTESHFTGSENVYAVYLRALYNMFPKWTVSSSIRMEYTEYELNLKSENAKAQKTYANYFPYIYLQYKHSQNYQTVFAFISGIFRPNYEHMLPGIRYHNEFSYSVGNPDLMPTIVKGLAWVHYLYGFGNITFRYQHMTNIMGRILTGKVDEVTEFTYLNYADNKRFGLSASLPFEFFDKKLNGNISGDVRYNYLSNPKNAYVIPTERNEFWKWNIKSIVNYQITSQFGINTWISYNSPYSDQQCDYKSNWGLDLGIAYSVQKNERLTFHLQAENIFNTYQAEYEYMYDGNTIHRKNSWNNRFLSFSVSLKFNGGEKIADKTRMNVNDTERFRATE
ncbi:MAG: outer membrane beta-barrel family protein [Tenuifilaceae bacterium]|nr:outer membrane beta-barrel family protein [Tenuifilaceae bacterium]